MWFWRKYVCRDLSSYKGWLILWTGKGRKKRAIGKSWPRVVGSDWKSLSGRHVPSPMSSSTTLRTPITIAACPVDVVCVGPISTPFSRGYGIVLHSPSSCTVRSLFPSIWLALYPAPSSPYRTPFPPLFLLLGTWPLTRLPR